jgi:phosphoglycolate phosphatase-like HAD superfamily hydrolase
MTNLSKLITSYQKPYSKVASEQITLFCDFDGPIVDVCDRYYATYELALAKTREFYQLHGQNIMLQFLTKEQFWQMKQDRVSDLEIAMRSGLQQEQIEYFIEYVRSIVNLPELLDLDKIQSGVNWALALLHSVGVRLVLVTLRENHQVKNILNNYGLKRLFAGIYGSEDVDVAYINNAQVKTELLTQAYGKHRGNVNYMVGDTEADLIAAKKVGVGAIALTCGIRSVNYLKQYNPDYICNDLLSVAHRLLRINSLTNQCN